MRERLRVFWRAAKARARREPKAVLRRCIFRTVYLLQRDSQLSHSVLTSFSGKSRPLLVVSLRPRDGGGRLVLAFSALAARPVAVCARRFTPSASQGLTRYLSYLASQLI